MALNIIFAGTPEFAAFTLKTLLASNHSVSAVYTQPDRPSGRGRKLSPSPVKKLALAANIPVYQPNSFSGYPPSSYDPHPPFGHPRNECGAGSLPQAGEGNLLEPKRGEGSSLEQHQADVMVVVAYGQLLPSAVLKIPRYGCINIHASLLPRWRGAAPIERAIEAGDKMTGITIMQMDEHLDTGDILDQVYCPIASLDNSASLSERLATIGAEALLKTLSAIEKGSLNPTPQDHQKATYANKISKQEAEINWQLSAEVLARKVRAFNPRPVAFTEINGQPLRIWEAQALNTPSTAAPGTVISSSKQGIDVETGEGVLRLLTIQAPGGRALSSSDFLNSHSTFYHPGS